MKRLTRTVGKQWTAYVAAKFAHGRVDFFYASSRAGRGPGPIVTVQASRSTMPFGKVSAQTLQRSFAERAHRLNSPMHFKGCRYRPLAAVRYLECGIEIPGAALRTAYIPLGGELYLLVTGAAAPGHWKRMRGAYRAIVAAEGKRLGAHP